MMLKYEMKKVWQKRSNRFLMAVVIILSVVFSIFAIYSLRFVDKDGEEHSGILAVRALVSDKNNWKEKEVTGAIKGMQIAGMSDNEIMTKIIENFNVTKEYVLALLTPQKS
ncbi:MAG: hypothetical protein IJ733_12095 [Lachnospiraceae bacterium]|nr:hypothetical protein [Lachnospiraceae bacterium]